MPIPEFTDQEVAEEVTRISNVIAWPLYPVLPMKNYRLPAGDRFGVLVDNDEADDGGPVTLYHVGFHEVQFRGGVPILDGIPSVTYPDREAMVRDGWIGD